MEYCKINLNLTNYSQLTNWGYIRDIELYPSLHEIYRKYCKYKKFASVMPLFDSQFSDQTNDIIGYSNNNKLVAFSIIKKYDTENVEALQFAWDYAEPTLRLGINSLKNECAVYKAQGFKYIYLGSTNEYKSKLDGYEILGTVL